MQKTVARSQTNTAPFASKGETDELPPLTGRLIPRPLLDAGHEPTETEELTETETGDLKSDDDEPQLGKSSPTLSQESLLPISELIERISRVNRAESAEGEVARSRPRRTINNTTSNQLLAVEDMTSILKHINLSEASDTPIRWDLIREQTAAVTGQTEEELNISMSTTSFVSSSPEETIQQVIHMLENEGNDDDSTGFSIEPTSHSCSSSITWCESSLFVEEEVLTTDDEEITEESNSWDT